MQSINTFDFASFVSPSSRKEIVIVIKYWNLLIILSQWYNCRRLGDTRSHVFSSHDIRLVPLEHYSFGIGSVKLIDGIRTETCQAEVHYWQSLNDAFPKEVRSHALASDICEAPFGRRLLFVMDMWRVPSAMCALHWSISFATTAITLKYSTVPLWCGKFSWKSP